MDGLSEREEARVRTKDMREGIQRRGNGQTQQKLEA